MTRAQDPGAISESASTAAGRLRVLVIEDDDDSRELLVEVLRMTGAHAIVAVESGREGLRRLRDEAFDLLVTDVGLPDVSGLEVVDRATREGLLARTATVVCSAFPWLREQVVARGARWIPKPLDPERVFDAVRERLSVLTRVFAPA